jgi:Uma2 family endonuclease
MIGDPLLADIHGKLELNEKGAIELTPSNNRHALVQAFVTGQLQTLLPEGTVLTECSVETRIGVRAPDVAWASPAFMRRHGSTTPFPAAPELCVEVLSPSNTEAEMTEKTAAYLAAGAHEVWLVADGRAIEIFGENGIRHSSVFGIELSVPP